MGMTNVGADLEVICAAAAGDLDDVTSTIDGRTTTYQRGDAVFARVEGSRLDLRLPPEIGEAALRTPDTERGRERGWIRFTPAGNENHVTDRAAAWFQTAWRHVASS
jgi:hypothetical protein